MSVPRSAISLRPARLALVCTITLTAACDKGQVASAEPETQPRLGYDNSSSEDFAPLPPALADHDQDGIAARSLTLWKMQRALRLGERAFTGKVGVTSAKFVALTSIDPAGTSGEVVFWRWDPATLEDGEASAGEARRWIVVPITIDPDEALEAQELDKPGDAEQVRTLSAVLLALATMEKQLPEARFETFAFREQAVEDGQPTKQRQTRVYMFGVNAKSPDIELTIADPAKRGKAPEVVAQQVHLEAGQAAALPLKTTTSPPGAMTLMRARAIASATSKPAEVVDGAGNTWHLDPSSGTLQQGPAPKTKKK